MPIPTQNVLSRDTCLIPLQPKTAKENPATLEPSRTGAPALENPRPRAPPPTHTHKKTYIGQFLFCICCRELAWPAYHGKDFPSLQNGNGHIGSQSHLGLGVTLLQLHPRPEHGLTNAWEDRLSDFATATQLLPTSVPGPNRPNNRPDRPWHLGPNFGDLGLVVGT